MQLQQEVMSKEHDGKSQPGVLEPLRLGMYGWDTDGLQWVKVKVDSEGKMKVING